MTSRHKWICAERADLAIQQRPRFSPLLKLGLATWLSLPGCALLHRADSSSGKATSTQRITQLEKMLRQQRGTIDEMRERNLVLEQRLRKSASSTAAANRSLLASAAKQEASRSANSSLAQRRVSSSGGSTSSTSAFSPLSSPSRGSSSAMSVQEMPSLNADEIVPVPFTPSAANGFDIDLAKTTQSTLPSEVPTLVPREFPTVVPTIVPRDVPTEVPLETPIRQLGSADLAPTTNLRESFDLRARPASVGASPSFVATRARADREFVQDSPGEVSSHRPGIGSDDLSFALKSRRENVPAQNQTVSVSSENTGEHYLYSKIVNSYREHKMAELTKSTELLLKSYPDSVFADNAIYLNGLLSFEMNALPQAELYMNRVIREFPQGNKVVAAIFAKAMIAKKMKKYGQSESILQQVARTFPGSPEAGRVNFEIKLMKVAQAGRIREL